jgi:hypothetical protein
MPAARATITPRQRIEAECERVGRAALVGACVALIDGVEVAPSMLAVLGGRATPGVLAGREGGVSGHWPRVWGARGLLHVWDDVATGVIIGALSDPAWRVREMALKVVARHRVDAALDHLPRLLDDEVPRVRQAALRAQQRLTEG